MKNKLNEVIELEKEIEEYYLLIRKGIDVSNNNRRIEDNLKEKYKYYYAANISS